MIDEQQQTPEETVKSDQETVNTTAHMEISADTLAKPTDNLVKQLEEAQIKADQHWNQLLRTRAEMENLQKRQTRELENAHKFALDNFVHELLQVWDSLELGQAAAQSPEADLARLKEGTELTLKLFSDVMGKFGVQLLNPLGIPFNHDYHQAMAMQPRSDLEPNHVAVVMQKGCTLNGRLVRPALVIVSQAENNSAE